MLVVVILRALLLVLAFASLSLLHSSGSAAVGASTREDALEFPSLHHARYQKIQLYAEPIHLSSSSSPRSSPALSALARSHLLPHPVHALEQHPSSTAHETYILRVKAPITQAAKERLREYLKPHKLGRYLPHHSFLVTIDSSAISSSSSSSLLSFLRAAPSVLFVAPRAEHHKVHPRLTQALERAEARNRRREQMRRSGGVEETRAHDAASELVDWSFTDFEPVRAAHRWRKSFSSAHSAAGPTLVAASRAFALVRLHVALAAHPRSKHDQAELLRATVGTTGHARRLEHEREEMQRTRNMVEKWSEQLRGLEMGSEEHEHLSPLDHADRDWLLKSGHAGTRLKMSHSMYDPSTPSSSSHSSFLQSVLSSPFHSHLLVLTPSSLTLTCSSWFLPLLVRFLASRKQVAWIEASQAGGMRTQNKYIHGIVQADRGVNATPVWEAGIKGQGQIVQLGDTGLDTDSCFFADPSRPVPVNSVDQSHRKLVTYQLFENADHGDDADGHGTHVGGSLAGCVLGSESPSGPPSLTPLSLFNGLAPLARLAFFDFKKSGADELLVPQTVYKPYLAAAYAMGARISSNSWGSPDGEYGSYCRELDQFAHDFPDSLLVFAAGNYGEIGTNTVSSPGVSKNVLTVGSTKTSPASFFDAGLDWGASVASGPDGLVGQGGFSVAEANFGRKFADLQLGQGSATPGVAKLVVADPADACAPLRNPAAALDGAVVLVRRGTCHFGEKAQAVQRASAGKAPLMLVVNNEEGPAAHMAGDTDQPEVGLCLVMVAKSIGESLISAALSSSSPSSPPLLLRAPIAVDPPNENEWSLSSFSSRGPTFGGRMKPDVLAPGEFVRSVKSDGTLKSANACPTVEQGILQLEGTSMATPVVAAAAALTRQYLQSGFYPSGVATPVDAILQPSSALIKAMLIHSALSTSGTVLTKKLTETLAHEDAVTPAPSYFQGYGRVLLEHVLRFAEPGENRTAAQIASPLMNPSMDLPNLDLLDQEPSLESDVIHTFCYLLRPSPPRLSFDLASNLTARGSLPFFRASLVWTDAPVAEGASFVLVNNLDLFVAAPTMISPVSGEVGRVWLGNSQGWTDASGRHESWDVENNAEMVSFDQPADMNETMPMPVFVHVRGTNVPDGPQHYALVVTGWFNDESDSSSASHIKHLPLSRCLSLLPPSSSSSSPLSVLCPSSCGSSFGRGNCSHDTGLCTCAREYAGADCSQRARRMKQVGSLEWMAVEKDEGEDQTLATADAAPDATPLDVPSDGWVYFFFTLSPSSLSSLSPSLQSLRFTLTRTSSKGDPDLFLTLGSSKPWPTLRVHDFANAQCDSCVNTPGDDNSAAADGKPTVIDVPAQRWKALIEADASAATIRVGVHGYCCDASSILLSVSPVYGASPISPWLIVGPLLGMLFVCVVAWLVTTRRRRMLQSPLVDSTVERSDAGVLVDATSVAPARPSSTAPRAPSSRAGPTKGKGKFMPLAKDEDETQGGIELQPHSATDR